MPKEIGVRLHAAYVIGLALPLLTSACSVEWQEADGSRRIIGLVDRRITDASRSQTFAGTVVDTTTVGLAISRSGEEMTVSAGYTRIVTAALRDNALIVGNPLALRSNLEGWAE